MGFMCQGDAKGQPETYKASGQTWVDDPCVLQGRCAFQVLALPALRGFDSAACNPSEARAIDQVALRADLKQMDAKISQTLVSEYIIRNKTKQVNGLFVMSEPFILLSEVQLC